MCVYLMNWLYYFKEGNRLARCIVKNNGRNDKGMCAALAGRSAVL